MENDMINHPSHYTSHPSGVECIQITEHMDFCTGSAMKYLWRYGLKNGLEDLKKCQWYLNRLIKNEEKVFRNENLGKFWMKGCNTCNRRSSRDDSCGNCDDNYSNWEIRKRRK